MTGATRPSSVSVIVTCYRQAHLLPEALASALAQHPRPEIIVVDDGSPDDVAGVVRRHPDVRYVRQRNQGISAARNRGLAETRADYVVFLDADDRLLPGALDAGLACAAEHPEAAFVFGDFRFMAADGTPQSVRVRPPMPRAGLYLALLRQNYVEMLATVLFRRDVLVREGGFRTELRSAEDYDLLLRLARGYPTFAHGALVAEYRRYPHTGASLSNTPTRMLRSTMRVLHAQWPYARGDAERAAALRAGIRFFQDYYGGELIGHTRALLDARDWRHAAPAALVLLRHYPRGLARRVASRTRNALRAVHG